MARTIILTLMATFLMGCLFEAQAQNPFLSKEAPTKAEASDEGHQRCQQ